MNVWNKYADLKNNGKAKIVLAKISAEEAALVGPTAGGVGQFTMTSATYNKDTGDETGVSKDYYTLTQLETIHGNMQTELSNIELLINDTKAAP